MPTLIVCHACDLVHRRPPENRAVRVRCVRCRAELYRTHTAGIDTVIALAVTAAVLLVMSNVYPLVALQLNGSVRATTLWGAARGLYDQGYAPVAALVLLTTVAAPLFQISVLLYVLAPSGHPGRGDRRNELLRLWVRLRPWAMSEVFMLGALVALVKLSAMADVVPGISLFAYGGLMLCLAALTSLTPTEQVWAWLGRTRA